MQLVMLAIVDLVRLLHESVLCICSLGDQKVVAMMMLYREERDHFTVMHCT